MSNPLNPYLSPPEVPADAPIAEGVAGENTQLPNELFERARWHLKAFGVTMFVSQFALAFIGRGVLLDFVAIAIMSVGMDVTGDSFRRFPWTLLLCALYPLAFGAVCLTILASGFPGPLSGATLLLTLLFVQSTWACYVMWLVYRCHAWHRDAARHY